MRYTRSIKSSQTRQLRIIAKEAGISDYGKMGRAELILELQLKGVNKPWR